MPSFWCWQGVLGEGVDIPALTAHIDLYRTFCDIAGADIPESKLPPAGRSLLPLMKDPDAKWDDRSLFSHRGRWVVVDAAKKRVSWPSITEHRCARPAGAWSMRWMGEGPWLSDISQDRGEVENLIDEFPEVAQKLKADFDSWWDSTEGLLVNEGLPRLRPGEYPLHKRYAKQLKEKGIPDWEPESFQQKTDVESSAVVPTGWEGRKSDWNGFQKVAFKVDGKSCFVVLPNKDAEGQPWVWRARFPKYHPGSGHPSARAGFSRGVY